MVANISLLKLFICPQSFACMPEITKTFIFLFLSQKKLPKVYRSTRYVFIHCLWLKIEFYVNLKPWIIDPAISNANLETLAKLDTF